MAASTIAPIAIAIPPKPRTGPEWRDKGGEATPLLLAGASERERRAATWIPQPLTRRLLVRKTIRIMSLSDARKARAETAFKRKEDQARDGAKAWAEYEAQSRAVAKNMERQRALRLTKEAAATAQPHAKPCRAPLANPRRGSHNQTLGLRNNERS